MRRPYCALYFEIYVVRSVQPARLAGGKVGLSGWTNPSHSSTLEDTIVTGVCRLDWKSSELAIKPTQFEFTMVRQARAPRFEIARFSNKEKNQSLQSWIGEAEKNNRKFQLGKNLKLLELWLCSIGIVILLHFFDPM